MNYLPKRQLLKIIRVIFLLSLIWVITNFSNIVYTIPIWLFIFISGKFSKFEYVSILICTELFNKIDTLTFGPFSIIQFFALFILIKCLANSKRYKLNIIEKKPVVILIVILLYFSISYFSYYQSISLSGINWLFIVVLTILSFDGTKEELLFFSWLFVLSVFVITAETFIVQLYYFPDFIGAKKYSFGNSNIIGFYAMNAVALIIYIAQNATNKQRSFLKFIFYFLIVYLPFSGGRLNLVILLFFFISLLFNPVHNFWLTKKKLVNIFIFLGAIGILFGGFQKLIFRNDNGSNLSNIKIENVEDLKNGELGSFTSGRSVLYYDAIQLIKEKPLFGNGFLSWNDANNKYNTWTSAGGSSKVSMHSTILQYLAETGIVGLGLYFLYLLSIRSLGKKLTYSFDHDDYVFGRVILWVVVFLFLGGLLDNNSLSFSLIHFIAGLGLILCFKNKYVQKSIIPYK